MSLKELPTLFHVLGNTFRPKQNRFSRPWRCPGLSGRTVGVSCPLLRSSWGDSERLAKDSIFNPFGDALLLSRNIFDRHLANMAETEGVDVLTEARLVKWKRHRDQWALSIHHGRTIQQRSTDILVDATGRSAYIAKRLGARVSMYDRLLALIGFFAPAPSLSPSLVEIEACSRGWWYSASLPDGGLAVNHYMDSTDLERPVRSLLLSRLDDSQYTHARVARCGDLREVSARPACSQRLDRCVGPGWIAVGDAAMSYDPLNSAGIVKAIRTGIAAAVTIRKGHYTRYQSWLDREFADYLKTRVAYYRLENRWPESPFWRRNQVLSTPLA